jgi:hypothetical protein
VAKPLKVTINDEAKSFVDEAATQDQVSPPEIVRKALDAYRYLREVQKADGKLVLQRSDGTLERIIRV